MYLPKTDVMANVVFVEYVVMQGHNQGWPGWPKPPPIPSKKNIKKTTYSIYNIHTALRVSMEEKRLE